MQTKQISVEGRTWQLADFGDAQPRIRDVDLAEQLGFERPRNIRQLIARFRNDLGFCCTVEQNHGGARGRPATEYWLDQAQAHFLIAKSETPRSTAMLKTMIAVFLAWSSGTQTQQAVSIEAIVDSALVRALPALIGLIDKQIDSKLARTSFATARPYEISALKRRLTTAADCAVRAKAYKSRRSALSALHKRMRTACGWDGTGSRLELMPVQSLPFAEREVAAMEREYSRFENVHQLPLHGTS